MPPNSQPAQKSGRLRTDEEEDAEMARDEQYILRTRRDVVRMAEDAAKMLEEAGRVSGETSEEFKKAWDYLQELAQIYLRVDTSLEKMRNIRKELQQLRDSSG